MHNFIFLLEPSDAAYSTQLKIGDLFMNYFGINENLAHEISNICYLSKDYSKSMTDTEKSLKEKNDSEIINSALQEIVKENEMIGESEGITHIIYAGDYYHRAPDNVLESIIIEKMQQFPIENVWLTKLRMQRLFVITKEKMKRICNPNGDSKMKLDDSKILTESDHNKMRQVQIDHQQLTTDFIMNFDKKKVDEYVKILFSKPEMDLLMDPFDGSVSEDIETFFETLGDKSMNMSRTTYHMSKMTRYELRLLEWKDKNFLKSFYVHSLGQNPDVKKIEMDSSDSVSKYVLSRCSRQTIILDNSS